MRAAAVLVVWALAILLAGCTTGALRRDMDVSGELPRAIGLGAFAPACIFFCFVDSRTSQGNVIPDDLPPPAPVRMKSHTEGTVSTGPSIKIKPKAKAKPKPVKGTP